MPEVNPEKVNVSLKKNTIDLLDEIARKKVAHAVKNGSFDIINLIRSILARRFHIHRF